MPIVISRFEDGMIDKPEHSQEQIDMLWKHIIKSFIERNPDVLDEPIKREEVPA